MLMNLKETLISSFFFHLILFLLMIAVSNYTKGFSGGIQKIVTVDLAMDDSKDRPVERNNSEDEQPMASSPPSDDKIGLPEQTVSNQPEKSIEVPEPEKKAEPSTEPAKSEKPEHSSIEREGFSSMEAYYQFIILHKKVFAQQAGARVNQLLSDAFKVNKREFYGGTAVVHLTYGTDGKLKEALVDSASPPLKAFLEELSWGFVPPPSAYSLGYTTVQIQFTVMEGYMSFNITPR